MKRKSKILKNAKYVNCNLLMIAQFFDAHALQYEIIAYCDISKHKLGC